MTLRVGWIADKHDPPGGAELTQQAFRDAAPDDVVVCPYPFDAGIDVDVWVVHNATTFDASLIERFGGTPVVKYLHDAWPHGDPALKAWLLQNARLVCCSPLHKRWYASRHNANPAICPPAMDLPAFREARQEEREGTVWLGAFTNPAKGIELACEWAHNTRTPIDFYGDGPLAPAQSELVRVHPGIPHSEVSALLGRSERLVFLPTGLEPFGRVVAEAHAAGCEVITNELVGARHYVATDPEALDWAAVTFWEMVQKAASVPC